MQDIFGPDGLIARSHKNYEYREGQVKMAQKVAEALADGARARVGAEHVVQHETHVVERGFVRAHFGDRMLG